MDKNEIINAGLKGIASEIPILGGLVTAYTEYDGAIKYRNIENFLDKLKEETLKVNERIDKDFLKTSEAVSLTRKTIDLAQKEYKNEKIKMYATFLAKSYTASFSSKQEKESILNTLELLSPLQLNCLILIRNSLPKDNLELGANYNPDAEEKLTFQYITESILVDHLTPISNGLSKREIEALLSSMSSIGIIETASARGWTQVGGKMGIIGYRPTKLGLVLLEYLEEQNL